MSILYDLLIAPMAYPFMRQALLTAVFVGAVCSLIGSYLLVKRWALLGDAISHAVLPGVAFAYVLGWPFFIGALVTGLLTALGIGFVERNSRVKSDAAMGILFIGAFALGLVVISRVRGHIDLYHVLFGNVLGVSSADLRLTAVTGLVVLLTVMLLWKELHLWSFDPTSAQVLGIPVRALHYLMMLLLSITIVASLQAVGIVLVVAMLITPPATAYLLTNRFSTMMLLSCVLGAAAGVIGLYCSYYWNIASGATMVLVSVAGFGLALFFSPSQGLVGRALMRWRTARRIALDDCLKGLHELDGEGNSVPLGSLVALLGTDTDAVRRLLGALERRGAVRLQAETAQLTAAGVKQARAIIRSHRLWERYLTDAAGMPWDAVHDAAHQLEHHTPPELADRLAETLGHPDHDPHGAPIPTREGHVPASEERITLNQLPLGDWGTVVHIPDEDAAFLRQMKHKGITPGARLQMRDDGAGASANTDVVVDVERNRHTLDRQQAARIGVRPEGNKPPPNAAG